MLENGLKSVRNTYFLKQSKCFENVEMIKSIQFKLCLDNVLNLVDAKHDIDCASRAGDCILV